MAISRKESQNKINDAIQVAIGKAVFNLSTQIRRNILNQIEDSDKIMLQHSSLPSSIRDIIANESYTSTNLTLLNVMVIIIRKYLHASWCIIPGRTDYYFNEIKKRMLIEPLRELFKINLKEHVSFNLKDIEGKIEGFVKPMLRKINLNDYIDFSFEDIINEKIDESIKTLFQDFLVKENIEKYCVSLLENTSKLLISMPDNKETDTLNQKYKMAAVLYHLYADAIFGYNKLELNTDYIDEDNKDKLEIFKKIMGINNEDETFSNLCNYYNPGRKSFTLFALRYDLFAFLFLMTLAFYKTGPLTIVNFVAASVIGILILRNYHKLKRETVIEQTSLPLEEKYFSSLDDLFSLRILKSVKASLNNKSNIYKKSNREDKKGKPEPKQNWKQIVPDSNDNVMYVGSSNLFPRQTSKEKKSAKKTDNEKNKVDDKDKLNELRDRIRARIGTKIVNCGNVEPTWFKGEVNSNQFDYAQFKSIRKTNTKDYFLLLPSVDSSQDNLFENISDIVYNDTLKPLKTSENTIFQCELNGKTYDMEVKWELRPNKKTIDRILVGRIVADEGNESNLYIGFKYIKKGFHNDSKLSIVFDGLRKTKIDLNPIMFCKKQMALSLRP